MNLTLWNVADKEFYMKIMKKIEANNNLNSSNNLPKNKYIKSSKKVKKNVFKNKKKIPWRTFE